jgi:hypothetical protein
MRGITARTMFVADALVVRVIPCSIVKDGPLFDGGGIGIDCFEEDGGYKGIVVGGS